jgi:hypothetical protein
VLRAAGFGSAEGKKETAKWKKVQMAQVIAMDSVKAAAGRTIFGGNGGGA